MPPGGRPGGGGGPRGGMGGMPRGGMPGGMPRGRVGMGVGMGMGGRPPMRGGSPLGGLIALVLISIVVLGSLISSMSPVVWISLTVVALVAIFLFYKYKSDRAKAEETQRILDTDLGRAPSAADDLESKYK